MTARRLAEVRSPLDLITAAASDSKRTHWTHPSQSAPKRTDMETLCPSVQSSGEAVRDQLSLGGILRAFLHVLLHLLNLGAHKLRVLWQLAACGTPALGANLFHCPHCQHQHWAPRSCGNRHCPRCLAAKSWQWLEKQTRSLLPITYYHCVFTLPAELHSLMLANQRKLYPLLFDCAAQSLLEFGRDRLHGGLGITAVLHTWRQTRLPSPSSLHCHRWSIKSGWQTVALTQTAQVPLSRSSACRIIPRQVPSRSRSDA